MFDESLLAQVTSLLSTAPSVLLLLPPQPDADSIAAATALHLTFKQAGKTSTIGCSTPIKLEQSMLFGIADIKQNIGRQNLIVSFPYKEEAVENVSYDIDEATGRFNLRIRPRPGAEPLDTKAVEYTYSGAAADAVITFAINSLEELGRLYAEEKDFLDKTKIINLASKPLNVQFDCLNLAAKEPATFAEVAATLLQKLNLAPTADAASNLYQQLVTTTQNFASPTTTATTFEVAAFLLRSGARRPQAAPTNTTRPASEIRNAVPGDLRAPSQWSGPKIFRGGGQTK
ncbi:hypothetical protein A2368_03645 [Candidatus Collierbacteria bacterium RIFOXYB1_FULL_49_13]|uniref:DDH domain-containing protein n=1 Tax=Candidatus Collierbacteria bacterium RIFOXYB1_FULL_49_13 TaxID=1817728 RepID=A0A1F5FKN3_9BACT|nr:MAG: hypothetical protein A2368_03645 [Candidatus Collierbacteria bacterium RIFOXYB1_FULL_49_13]